MTDDIHDPIDRALPGEPHLMFLARDVLLPGIGRIYAIARERGPDHHAKAHAALDAMLLANDGRDPQPHKDKDHAWSVRRVCDLAEEWYRLNMLAKPQAGKVNTGTDKVAEQASVPTLAKADLFAIGDEIILNAPVHFRYAAGDLGQLITGSVGTIRDVDVRSRSYVVAFDGYIEANYFVPFDRCDVVDV